MKWSELSVLNAWMSEGMGEWIKWSEVKRSELSEWMTRPNTTSGTRCVLSFTMPWKKFQINFTKDIFYNSITTRCYFQHQYVCEEYGKGKTRSRWKTTRARREHQKTCRLEAIAIKWRQQDTTDTNVEKAMGNWLLYQENKIKKRSIDLWRESSLALFYWWCENKGNDGWKHKLNSKGKWYTSSSLLLVHKGTRVWVSDNPKHWQWHIIYTFASHVNIWRNQSVFWHRCSQ